MFSVGGKKMWPWYGFWYPWWGRWARRWGPFLYPLPWMTMTKEQEREFLEEQLKVLEEQIELIKRRLEEIKVKGD